MLAVGPNPSLEGTATGMPLGPPAGLGHHPSGRPSATPALAPQLKRWASHMHRSLVLVSFAILAGCSSAPQYRYWNTYKVEGAEGQVDGRSAEQLQIAAANSTIERAVVGTVNNAFKLVRAPQPVMSPEDIDNRVTGEVRAVILFAESGEVESVAIVESSKESLSISVRQAVQQWRITPPTAAGKPTKMRIGQVFSFKANW